MGLINKAEESVTSTTPHVIEALRKIKFLLIGIPILCVVVGLVSQKVLPERNVATVVFKIGSFATPDRPDPEPLASETQMKARLRANATELREEYSNALLITTIVDSDVVSPTATGLGPEQTRQFLSAVVQREIDFQNSRLEKLRTVQSRRSDSLTEQLKRLTQRINTLSAAQRIVPDPVALLALQQEVDNARTRTTTIQQELDAMAVLNASDLYIDTTQIIRPPFIVASSNWYRPVIYGAAGLAVGLFLVFVLAIIAVVRALTRKKENHTAASD